MATVKEYFQAAERENATDIYFRVGSPPFLKINGALKPIGAHGNFSKTKIERLVRQILSTEKWSAFESGGEFITTYTMKDLGRLRVVFSHERHGPCMACHLIPLHIPEFDSLKLPPFLKTMISATGLILVMGRARSGKTTTLASLIRHINNTSEKSVLTLETPMEYDQPHNRSFMEPIRLRSNHMWLDKRVHSGLLETADVMVIDGLPFEETVSQALRASTKGLLVLGTLETNGGVAEVLTRMIHTASGEKRGSGRRLLARMLRCAIWQHLLPLKDGSGLTPAVEVLINEPDISRLISQKGRLHLLRPTMAARRYKGMQTMHQALETLKQESIVQEDIISAFADEILNYYVSPIKGSF